MVSPEIPKTDADPGLLSQLYKAQDEEEKSPTRKAERGAAPSLFAAACGLEIVAGLLAPWTILSRSDFFVIICNPLWAVLGFIIIGLAAHALYRRSRGEAYIAGALGLLTFSFFFVGTILSLVSLLFVRWSERGEIPSRKA